MAATKRKKKGSGTDKDAESPATTSFAYDAMAPRWAKVDALLGGTETMKAAGKAYMPQHDEESDLAYGERLLATSLFNMTELTLDTWVGKPFGEPIKVLEDTPEELKGLMDDIDLQGNSLDVYCRNWFRSGLAKAFSFTLIDFPKKQVDAEGNEIKRTVADARRERLRPYWIDIQPERIIFMASEMIDGQEVLTHIRVLDHVTEMIGFSEVVVPKIRVFEPGTVDTYGIKNEGKRNEEWQLEKQETYDLDFIPVVAYYADRHGLGIGKPPLTDLADLNVTHWQSSSDQRATLTIARFPILALSGGTDENNKITIGPRKWLYSPDPQSKFYYVEHEGKALEAGREDLSTLEEQMAFYGADFMRKRASGTTATARVIDNAETTSPLQDATQRFQDAVNTALVITAEWMQMELADGGVEINNEFGGDPNGAEDLKALVELRKNRDISRKTVLTEHKRRGVLPDEFDVDAELLEMEKEALTLGGGSNMDFDTDESAEEKAKREAEEEEARKKEAGE